MTTFKLAPNENGADTADDPPAMRAFRDFCRDLADNAANGSGQVRMRIEMDSGTYAALRRHFQRPYKPKPTAFTIPLSEAGRFFGMVEFVRKDDA